MTDWNRGWSLRCQTRRVAKSRKFLKRLNHRLNRRLAKKLDTVHIRLNGWDVI
jgi:ABC-type uncharacterized transport system ATPase component